MQAKKKKIASVKDSQVESFFEIFGMMTASKKQVSTAKIAQNDMNVNKKLLRNDKQSENKDALQKKPWFLLQRIRVC